MVLQKNTIIKIPLVSERKEKKIFFFLFLLFFQFLFSGEYDIILKKNVFASIPAEKKNKKEIVKILKFPSLDELLELKGTFVMKKKPSSSLAIIEVKKKNRIDFYHIGDTVEGAKIIDIQENRVLMEYGFEEMILSNKGCYLAPINADYTYEIDIKKVIEKIKEESEVLLNLRCEIVIENGKIKGYRISGIKKGSIIEKLGIKNGDIIEKINTIYITSPEKAIEIYENIMKHGIKRVVVKILRNNLPHVLLYHLHTGGAVS